MSRVPTVVVFTGGDPVTAEIAPLVPEGFRIAADSGLLVAEALGLPVDLVVGDMDSVPADVLTRAAAAGAEIRRYPERKDQSDLELALDAAMALSPERVVVVGGGGGRLDHLLTNVAVLAGPGLKDAVVDAIMPPAVVHVVWGLRTLPAAVGETATVLAPRGDTVVSLAGFTYDLRSATLRGSSSLGLSNVVTETGPVVHAHDGVVLVVRPGGVEALLDEGAP